VGSLNRHHALGLSVACLLILLAVNGCSRVVPALLPTVSRYARPIPHTAVDQKSHIFSLDLGCRGDTLHVIWNNGAQPQSQLLHIRSDDRGRRWTRPTVIADGTWARLCVGPGRLHVLEGYRLRHFLSEDGGNSWTYQGELAPSEYGARGCDAVCLEDTLTVAYMAPEEEQQQGQNAMTLHLARWTPSSQVSDRVIGTVSVFAWDPLTVVSLARENNDLHLACGIDDFEEVSEMTQSGQTTLHSSRGKLLYWHSEDGGLDWSGPTEVLSADPSDRYAGGPGAVAAAAREGQVLVAYSGSLVASPTSSSSRRSKIVPVRIRTEYGEFFNRTLDMSRAQDKIVVASISGRLAGWSWPAFLQNPEDALMIGDHWRQTDIFVSGIAEDDSLGRLGASGGLRLTWPLAYATCVRVCLVEDTLVCVWSGRAKVGRSLFAYGAPPELFCAKAPFSEFTAVRSGKARR
jgi:hypothetical protein